MRYLILICVVLLALILVIQVRMLSLLGDITNRRMPVVTYDSPNPSTIAADVFRQMEQQEQPSFIIQPSSHSYSDGRLQRVVFWLKRKTGPATDVSIMAEPDVIAQIKNVKCDESDCDEYQVTLIPKSGLFLSTPFSFSIPYIDHDEKAQQRAFEVNFYTDKEPPTDLQITEKQPNTALTPTATAP